MTSPTPSLYAAPVLAHVVRSGFVESVHHGSVVAVDGAGTVAARGRRRHRADLPAVVQQAAAGARDGARRPRPRRRAARAGLRQPLRRAVPPRRRAPASSPARGCSEDDLQNTPDLPVRRRPSGGPGSPTAGRPAPLAQNCSGKHAAMLATCVVERLGPRDLPRPGAPAAAADGARPLRRAGRRAGRRDRRRRLRRPGHGDLADRPGPGVRPARLRRGGHRRGPGRRRRSAPTRSSSAAPAATSPR